MVFFVLLFSMSSGVDTKKIKEFQKELQSALGILLEGKRVSVKIIKSVDKKSIDGQLEGEKDSELKAEEDPATVKKFIKNLDANKGIKATYTEKGMFITLEGRLLFDLGTATINPESYPVLNTLAETLKSLPHFIRVAGHTDNIAISTEQFPSNWELSTKRAVNVVKYLVKQGNVEPWRLSAVGYGDSRPIFPNDTPLHRAANRRVEIVLVKKNEILKKG